MTVARSDPEALGGVLAARVGCRRAGRYGCCGAHDDLDTFSEFADTVHFDGVAERIRVPSLIAHGANDPADPRRERPPALRPGDQQPEARTADPPRRRATPKHIGLDHLPHVSALIADRIADTLAET